MINNIFKAFKILIGKFPRNFILISFLLGFELVAIALSVFSFFTDKVIDKISSGDAMMSLFSIILHKTSDPELSIFLTSLAAAQSVQILGNSQSINKIVLLKTHQHIL